jgi:hypothetical protein
MDAASRAALRTLLIDKTLTVEEARDLWKMALGKEPPDMTGEMLYWSEYFKGIINRTAQATLCDRAVIAQKLFDRYQGVNDFEAGARIACNHIILEEMEGLDVSF